MLISTDKLLQTISHAWKGRPFLETLFDIISYLDLDIDQKKPE